MKRLAVLLGCLLALSARAATISGTVTADGAPLAAMNVAAYTAAGTLQATVSTNASGTYALTVPAGTYRVLAYDAKGAYATSFYADAESFDTAKTLTLTSSQTASNINFQLVHAGFVVGVVAKQDGVGVEKITVAAYNLSGTRRGFTTTDASGRFTLALPPGTYKIAAYDEALEWATSFFDGVSSFDAASNVIVAAQQTSTANFLLAAAAKVSGVITDRATLAPLGGMRVTAYAADGTIAARTSTGSDGRFAMAVRAGSLRFVADDPAGTYATTFVPDAESFSMTTAVSAVAGQTVTVNASMVRAGFLRGRVTDAITGAPLAGITAAAYNADGTVRAFAVSDATGAFSIVVPPGDFRLGASDASLLYLPWFYPVGDFGAASAIHVIAQQAAGGLDVALRKAARITGHTRMQSTGTAVGAMTVAAYDLFGKQIASTKSGADGAYTLLLPAQTVKLLAFDESHTTFATTYYANATSFAAAAPVALTDGGSVNADLFLPLAGWINGSVFNAEHTKALGGIQVFVYDAAGNTVAETTTGADGAFLVTLPDGRYSIAVYDPGHQYEGAAFGSTVQVTHGFTVVNVNFALSAASAPPVRRSVRH